MDYTSTVLAAAKKAGVAGNLMLAICTHESGLKNVIVPHDGGSPSYGVCQIKKDTAMAMGYRGDAKELMRTYTNAFWAAKYLKYQLQRYNGDACMAVAAYNAGKYYESRKFSGMPKNLGYIKKVEKHYGEILCER